MLNESETPKKRTPRKTTASDSAPKATRSTTTRGKKAAPKVAAPTAPEPIAVVAKTEPLPPEPTHEQIARKAFEIYLARGRQEGRAADDWLRAELELRKREGRS